MRSSVAPHTPGDGPSAGPSFSSSACRPAFAGDESVCPRGPVLVDAQQVGGAPFRPGSRRRWITKTSGPSPRVRGAAPRVGVDPGVDGGPSPRGWEQEFRTWFFTAHPAKFVALEEPGPGPVVQARTGEAGRECGCWCGLSRCEDLVEARPLGSALW